MNCILIKPEVSFCYNHYSPPAYSSWFYVRLLQAQHTKVHNKKWLPLWVAIYVLNYLAVTIFS